jgi:hypothetical protein
MFAPATNATGRSGPTQRKRKGRSHGLPPSSSTRSDHTQKAQFGSYTKNGGFAEYLLADPNYVAHIPAGLSSVEAAPLICAGITTYKGIKESGAKPGEWLAISGAGGLGHLAIQYAKAMGLLVCAIDIDDGKLAHAKRVGADLVINAKSGDPATALKKETGGGAHGVLITAPSLIAFKQGAGMTRKRGRPGRSAARRISGSSLRCSSELHNHPRFVRRHPPGYGRSTRFCHRGQGQSRYRAAAFVIDQPGLRPASAWRGGITCRPRFRKILRPSRA